jgi:hypothetical protein
VTLRCGVAHATSGIGPITIDAVSFLTEDKAGVTTWTTTDRAVNVAVGIPKAYEEQVYEIQPLIPAISKALPTAPPAPGP